MTFTHGPDPFFGRNPFGAEAAEQHDEGWMEVMRFRELHESIEAKLLEVNEVVESVSEGHAHPGVWAAYITAIGQSPDQFGNLTYDARALTDSSIQVGDGFGSNTSPVTDRQFDPQIVEYKSKIAIPVTGLLGGNTPPNYIFADSYCEIVQSFELGNGGVAQGSCRFGAGITPLSFQCLDEVDCGTAGGTFFPNTHCFEAALHIKAYEKPVDPEFCPDVQPAFVVAALAKLPGMQQIGQNLVNIRALGLSK